MRCKLKIYKVEVDYPKTIFYLKAGKFKDKYKMIIEGDYKIENIPKKKKK